MELQKPWPSVVLAWESSCFSSLPYLLPVSKVGIKKKLENSCVYYFIFFVTFTLLQTMAKYPLYIWHKMKTWNVEWKGSASVIEKITAQPPPQKKTVQRSCDSVDWGQTWGKYLEFYLKSVQKSVWQAFLSQVGRLGIWWTAIWLSWGGIEGRKKMAVVNKSQSLVGRKACTKAQV